MIYQDKYLVLEQILYLFIIAISELFKFLFDDLTSESNNDSFFQDHATVIATLTTFALSFYLSTCVQRWWRLRTDGVGSIWAANNNLPIRLRLLYKRYQRQNGENIDKQLEFLNVFTKI